ncbi:metal ABC transporter substrate-binding protein [Candidatus Phytoplasma melaleucae]|uniref:Metal ABC transporter substrate-binding protein n=1 Tax=Candidatus Phytoplasma melaleucae TaxID=2982630 RepID=A0ABT9DDZ7_9MOLU|nr:metal ABC transporter substrate-binding protein ['Melaleuca sp.' phytoplasma]MDO8168242.1 metal ABC transporter substrate-binding protein ['Melaleuca sp.' phytoplasma]MDV3205310.1 metal ABC transporter substrate-binding protein [Weeping tea tree witches'-broom phytoplasma]
MIDDKQEIKTKNFSIKEKNKIIKIATNFPSTLATLQKTQHLMNKEGFALEVISENQLKEKYQINCNDALKEEIIDFNIANNFHTMKAYNKFFIINREEQLEMICPLFHPKYGLYANKKNPLNITCLEDIKKYCNLRLLFAPFNDLFTAPCDFSRSLLLLKKLNLIKIDEQIIEQKGYNLNLNDIDNIYHFNFIKTNNIMRITELFNDHNAYDLAINCPGFMRTNVNFIRLGSIGLGKEENDEPTDITFASYAIIVAAKKNKQDKYKVQAIENFLQNKEVKQSLFENGGPGKDYIIVQNPGKLKEMILSNFAD